jgi:O-antigen/teichoic acid export membrane protein/rubredoxin
MAELVKCKSCGYVMAADKPGDTCPACGVPRKLMEPWKDPVSESRRAVLAFDLHPIVLHFSMAFVSSAFVLALFVLLAPGLFREQATLVLEVFVGVLPLAVLASFLSGLFDGKIRFRRTNTPALTRKKLLGLCFFASSVAAAVITFVAGPSEPWVRVVAVVLLAVGVGCAVALGRIGRTLIHALFPG